LEVKTPELCYVEINSQIKHIKMKKITLCIMTALILMSFVPAQVKAETEKANSTTVVANSTESAKTSQTTELNLARAADAAEIAESNANLSRLEEIRAMDMSSLTPAEKKELREEVHMIQDNQERHDRDRDRNDNDGPRHHHGGMIFIGGGGILLIILILLLL
jgi:hypothetical protein